jgi:hypothetical protein
MRLYAGPSSDFVPKAMTGQIADRLADAFFTTYRHKPSPSEEQSWRNSLSKMAWMMRESDLNDNGVFLEYELPMSSNRLDCLITGTEPCGRDCAVIVELKQWDHCRVGDGDRVVTYVGGSQRDVLHPSVQVGQYRLYLEDTNTAFHEGDSPVALSACSYLHNYVCLPGDPILDPKYDEAISSAPLFAANDEKALSRFLKERLGGGGGLPVLERVDTGQYCPSKKLLDHVGKVLEGKPEYILLDEQLVAFDRVITEARRGATIGGKSVVLVRGGPGTGKSVIALNLLAALSKDGINTHYIPGSRAFTTTLRNIVGKRAAAQLGFSNGYGGASVDQVEVMVCDESHRIREVSDNRFTRKVARTGRKQIDELLHAAKVLVFFIDDKQIIRPKETGSSDTIRDAAHRFDCRLFEYELTTQFRCAGSEDFVRWVNNTLEVERTPNVLWKNAKSGFDFRILPSPEEVEQEIIRRAGSGESARMTAGYCWPWSKPNLDGTLVEDVVVGDYRRPWNARPDAGHLHPSAPPGTIWAYDPRGIGQVGCIYTAQGFEFDYIGVIFGKDLVYRHELGWVGKSEFSFDKPVKQSGERFTDLVKSVYRVLLTRGMKGCYVHFMDKETEQFFMSRTERA